MASYVYRHWRGELSLPVSYWLNGCLLSVTLNALGLVTMESSAWQLQAFGASLALLGIPVIAVWQLIGIYRSATRRLGIWSKLAKGSVVFGWLRLIAYLGQLMVGFDNQANQHATATPRKQPAAATTQASNPEGLRYVDRDLGNDEVMLYLQGEIAPGDSEKFINWIKINIKQQYKIIALNSRGGNVREALLLAQIVQKSKFSVMVEANHKCISACFLIFAAGDKRFASQGALIGVHSSYLPDKGENNDAKGVTLDLARIAHEQFDIPPSIIGRMVATPPDKVYSLNRADLAEMGVQITEDPAVAILAPQPATPNTIGAAAFKQGLADRTEMETWFSGLTGNFRAGALYWANQHLSPHPGGCESGNGEFSAGCVTGRYKLAAYDKLWKTNPEYQAGWNSYGH